MCTDPPQPIGRPLPITVECLACRACQYDWRRGPPGVHHATYVNTLERVVLPLATDGRTVDMLLGMTVFYWNDGRVRG